MKKIFNVYNIGLVLAIALISVFALKPVKAAGTVTWSGANSVTIDRTINDVTIAPTVTYTYTVAAVSGNPDGAGSIPTSATVAFNGSESVTSNSVNKTQSLSFSGATFTKPGDYSYTITESATNNVAYPIDSTNHYTVIISVRNAVDANNIPTGDFNASLVLKDKDNSKVETTGGAAPEAAFVSSPDSSGFGHISVSSAVKGTTADLNEYFPYTVTLSDSTNTYSISGLDSAATCTGVATQPSTVSGGTATFCLKHGQTAVIGQDGSAGSEFDSIPTSVTYGVSVNNLGYDETKYSIDSGAETTGTSFTNHALNAGNNQAAFTNNKSASALTGVLTTIIPYILVVIIAVCGTVAYTTLKQRKQGV